MQQDNLDVIAQQFVELKVPFVDAEYKKELTKEIKEKLEDTINMVLISYMDADQIDQYNSILEDDNSTDEEFLKFYEKCNININNIMTEAITRFKIAYLGT